LLESLIWLEANVKTPRTLVYGDLKLIDADRPCVQLLGNAPAIAALNATLVDRGLPALPEKSPGEPEVKLAIGTRAELEPLLGQSIIEKANPPKGSYRVVLDKKTIAVLGGDDAGALLGSKILGQLIESPVP
jgi:hypothetical protein